MAEDLGAVVAAASADAGGKVPVVIGHSMGGMIDWELMKRGSSAVERMVQVHTTYTNPLRTTKHARLHSALQKPLIEPLLHLAIWFSPLVRLMNWLSYLNGTSHLSTMRSGFVRPTFEMVDFVTKYSIRSSPAVVARMALAMLRWDASAVLPAAPMPVLVVAADSDGTCTPAASEHMRANVPAGELATLAPAKHFGFLEHHRAFTGRVRGVLAELSSAAKAAGREPLRPLRNDVPAP
jgi:pimeloyl-ACP methyl ester carboxylesterase